MTNPQTSPLNQTQWKQIALSQGFPLAGISPATISEKHTNAFSNWIDKGYASDMSWIINRKDEKINPALYFKGATAVLVLGLPYNPKSSGNEIHLASYSNGEDYHDTIKTKLWKIVKELKETFGEQFAFRPCVDTSPVLERAFAQQANLGWQGKNTMLINQKLGSYFFIAEIFTNIPVEPNLDLHPDRCGTCTACLDACPTKAFDGPYVLNSAKCISYQTIENKSNLDQNLDYKNWVYGCDICNNVCPWNKNEKDIPETLFLTEPLWGKITLAEILSMNEEQFKTIFRKTPIKRIKRFGLIRNALTVWQQNPQLAAVSLVKNLTTDADPSIQTLAKDAILQYNTTIN